MCPPSLAQGAAIGLEDAVVLAELLTGDSADLQALLTAYYERRIGRVRMVVDNSVQLYQWQRDATAMPTCPAWSGAP